MHGEQFNCGIAGLDGRKPQGATLKLAGTLTARGPELRLRWILALALEIERHGGADEILQSRLVDLVAFVDVDGAPDIALEARVEKRPRILQRRALGECHLDHVLVRLSRTDDAGMREDRSSRRGRFYPLPFFDDLRVRFVYDLAHFRQRLPAPVSKVFDLLVNECRSGYRCNFHRDGFHTRLRLSDLI